MKKKIIISIDKMSCEHCVKKVKDALSNLNNVKKVKVSLKKGEAIITTTDNIDYKIIKQTIENLDYKIIDIKEV